MTTWGYGYNLVYPFITAFTKLYDLNNSLIILRHVVLAGNGKQNVQFATLQIRFIMLLIAASYLTFHRNAMIMKSLLSHYSHNQSIFHFRFNNHPIEKCTVCCKNITRLSHLFFRQKLLRLDQEF